MPDTPPHATTDHHTPPHPDTTRLSPELPWKRVYDCRVLVQLLWFSGRKVWGDAGWAGEEEEEEEEEEVEGGGTKEIEKKGCRKTAVRRKSVRRLERGSCV
ncbi:hypothetical protein E2C01_036997 [Portunus trituberculatus]|uniref:Uncharacterized protein n=1 Tax=Portunus trituberculatus TaxID=210409 RepID=A0A5B7FA85_PORTR|nr:hypothetical protein [Portunus trituberculatus]